jgi:signal transduction histidine kinase/CheY-like chemotaxis protein
MTWGSAARLAGLLAQGGDPWPAVLAELVARTGAEVALVLLHSEGKVRRLACHGPMPPAAASAADEEALAAALTKVGMTGVWTHAFRRDGELVGVAALARRAGPFSGDDRALLEEAAPVLALGVEIAIAQTVHTAGEEARRRLEQRVAEIERHSTIGSVAAAVAHDLAAPISALLMEIGAIRERLDELGELLPQPGPMLRNVIDDLRGLADHCTDSTERARSLLIDFRLAAHPMSEAAAASHVTVHVGDTLRSCVRLVMPLARERTRVELTVTPDIPIIPGTRKRLEQAFTNLLVNAIHAASIREAYAGLVEARARREGEEIVVEVIDNGAGIPDEVKARMFEPFFTTKAPGVGTGLGLPIAREAIEAHGGRMEVESQRGRGACFRVHIPIIPIPAHGSPTMPRRSVLVVDDDELVRRSLERILRPDFDVTLARSGVQALGLLEEGRHFDALIVDLIMPGLPGPELYVRIRERWPGLEQKIIFSTGGAFTVASREFLASVPNSRFEKPISREELRPILARVVNAA